MLDGSYYDDFEIIDELYEDRYGIYVLSDTPLEVGWIGWHIGGQWEAAVSGVQPTTEAKCLCSSWQEHVRLNSCPVAELSMAILPDLLITPDGAWYSRGNLSVVDWIEIIQAAIRRFQDDLAIGVDCCIPFPETEEVPLAEEEAWERDREADLTNPIERLFPAQFPSGLPPYLSNQVRLFFRYVGFLRRLRLRMRAEDEILVTAHDWLNEWLYLCEFDISQTKQKRYELTIRQFLSWYEAKTQRPLTLREITPDLVTSYSFMLQRKVRVGTVMYHLRVLRKWAMWLMMPRGDFSAETVRHLGFLIEELERSRCRQIS